MDIGVPRGAGKVNDGGEDDGRDFQDIFQQDSKFRHFLFKFFSINLNPLHPFDKHVFYI